MEFLQIILMFVSVVLIILSLLQGESLTDSVQRLPVPVI